MADLQVLHDVPRFGIAARRNVMVALWRDAPRLEWLSALREHSQTHGQQWPDGTGFLNLIVDGTPRFSEDARREAAALTRRENLYVLGTAHVVEVDGLRGSATRAFLGTIFLLARPSSPTKVFASIADAAPWFVDRLGGSWTAKEIIELARQSQERLGLAPDPPG